MEAFLPTIPFFCIHLLRETGRDSLIADLAAKLGRPVEVWAASEGAEVAARGWPRGHPHERQTSIGALGCLDSHIRLLRKMVEDGSEVIGIFEDDAEVIVDTGKLREFYEKACSVFPKWNILVLGANEWVDFAGAEEDMVSPNRYWGTHAFLIRRYAAIEVLSMFEALQKRGYSYPADWLYSNTIAQRGLVAYGPAVCRSLIRQKPGLISAINGKVRT